MKKRKKSRDRERISRTLNRNKYVVACIRVHAHTYVAYTHHKRVSVQSLIRLAYAGKRCCPHVMHPPISVDDEDAIISTYVNDIMEYHPSLSRNHFFFFLFFFYYLYLICETLASVKIKLTDVTI